MQSATEVRTYVSGGEMYPLNPSKIGEAVADLFRFSRNAEIYQCQNARLARPSIQDISSVVSKDNTLTLKIQALDENGQRAAVELAVLILSTVVPTIKVNAHRGLLVDPTPLLKDIESYRLQR